MDDPRDYPEFRKVPFDRLNPRARRVIQFAATAAARNGDDYIGSEHLLLAIAQPGNGMGWSFLDNAGCADAVRSAIEEFLTAEARKRATG